MEGDIVNLKFEGEICTCNSDRYMTNVLPMGRVLACHPDSPGWIPGQDIGN